MGVRITTFPPRGFWPTSLQAANPVGKRAFHASPERAAPTRVTLVARLRPTVALKGPSSQDPLSWEWPSRPESGLAHGLLYEAEVTLYLGLKA